MAGEPKTAIATTVLGHALIFADETGVSLAWAVRRMLAAAAASPALMEALREAARAEVEHGSARTDAATQAKDRGHELAAQAIEIGRQKLARAAAGQGIAAANSERSAAKASAKPPKLTPEEKAAAKMAVKIALEKAQAEDGAVYNWACKLARQRESLRATLGREPTPGELRGRFLRWYANFKPHLSEAEAVQESIQSFGLPGASGRGLAIEKELAAMAGPPPLAPLPRADGTVPDGPA